VPPLPQPMSRAHSSETRYPFRDAQRIGKGRIISPTGGNVRACAVPSKAVLFAHGE